MAGPHRLGMREENIGEGAFGGNAVAGGQGEKQPIKMSKVKEGTVSGISREGYTG